jgi:hypothetical protein
MKKIFLTAIITSVVMLSSSMFGFSQSENNSLIKGIEANIGEYLNVNSSEEMSATDVNIKAVRNFTKQFSNVSDAKWYKTSEGLCSPISAKTESKQR